MQRDYKRCLYAFIVREWDVQAVCALPSLVRKRASDKTGSIDVTGQRNGRGIKCKSESKYKYQDRYPQWFQGIFLKKESDSVGIRNGRPFYIKYTVEKG